MAIPSEITRSLAKVARANFRLQADVRVLASMLEMCQTLRQPPEQWRELWRQARETPEYRGPLDQFEPQLAKLEKVADENEVLEILPDVPEPEFLN